MIRFLQNPTRGRKFVLGAILAVVIVSMVLYLGNYFAGGGAAGQQGVYAVIGDQVVTTQQIQDMARRQGRRQFPNGYPEQFGYYLNKQAADNLVMQAALAEDAHRLGLRVTDAELADELRNGPFAAQLFPGGKFIGTDQYRAFIYDTFQLSVEQFEELVKADLLINKLRSIIEGPVTIAPEDVRKAYIDQNTKVKFEYAVLKEPELEKQVTVNDAELKAYFDKNKSRWENSIPEKRKVRYVVVDPSKIKVDITDADYQQAYQKRQDQFRLPEEVDVRHILVKTQEEAENIRKQLLNGADFAKLAKKYSQDPGSKDNGGLYKGIKRGVFVKPFEDVAFKLKPGEISEPVKTDFGYHIIKVDAHHEARQKPLDEVKAELEPIIRQEKLSSKLQQMGNSLVTEVRSQGLDKAAADHGLDVVTTDYFSSDASLPGLGNAPNFMQDVFSMKPKSPAEMVELQQGGFAVVEVVDSKPASTPTFEQVKSQVEQQLRSEKARELLTKKTQELADRAHALHSLKQAAKEVGADYKTSDFVGANAPVPELGSLSGPAAVLFDMDPGQISGPLTAGANGAVVMLDEKQQPPMAEFDAKKEQIRDGLLQRRKIEAFALYAEQVHDRMEKKQQIKINADEQKRLLGPLVAQAPKKS